MYRNVTYCARSLRMQTPASCRYHPRNTIISAAVPRFINHPNASTIMYNQPIPSRPIAIRPTRSIVLLKLRKKSETSVYTMNKFYADVVYRSIVHETNNVRGPKKHQLCRALLPISRWPTNFDNFWY